ncbi:hypothetical protein ACIPY5_03615 [Microbacterium sp. NPDC089698]|uniref:hypothetical protein n=1 Tax=Microbacterium sp. NPDC089698 TaxID=3364200 RepID=UPI0038201CFA
MRDSASANEYRLVGLGIEGAAVDQYVIDTMVISHMEGLVRAGERTVKTEKLASLCRELAAHPQAAVIDDFAWIEGSSFHNTDGLSPTSIVMRDIATGILLARPADLLSLIGDLDGWRLPDNYESDVRASLNRTLPGLLLTVVPCYVAALTLERRYGDSPASRLTVDDVVAVIEVLSSELNFVPGVLLSALKLACAGTEDSRKTVMRVLKTGRRSKKSKQYQPIQNALSAAWDIGVLQLLSAKLQQGINAVLVTEDNALADFAELLTITNGWVSVTNGSFETDSESRSRAHQIDAAYFLRRLTANPELPDGAVAADVMRRSEAAAAGSSSFPDVLEHGLSINFPTLEFWTDDLDRIAAMLQEDLDGEGAQRLGSMLEGDLVDLRARFDAAFALIRATLEIIQTNRQVSLDDVLLSFSRRDDYALSVATVIGAFANVDEEPYRAVLYRELLTRPNTIKLRLTSIVGGLAMVTREWAPHLGVTVAALVAAAVGHVIETWPQAEAD